MKINFFSPLPDERTDIANMSAMVLPELAALAEVRAWTAQATWRGGLGRNYTIHRFVADEIDSATVNWADVSFFNIGNNGHFHRSIFNVARRFPGIVILHDLKLAHFVNAYADTPGPDREYYLAEMERTGMLDEAQRFLAAELRFESFKDLQPMTEAVLRPAIGGVVHNPDGMRTLADASSVQLFHVPLCLATTMRALPIRTPRKAGDRGTWRILVFGFIGENRCLPDILRALAGIPEVAQYHLDVLGTLAHPDEITALLRYLRLTDVVTIHGFVNDDKLERALERADLAINLRNPTMGEASGSQLRIWASGLPSLVSDTGWYSTLPEDAVFRIALGAEVTGVRDHLVRLRGLPDIYRGAGLRGRAALEKRHQPAEYARALMQIAGLAPRLQARRSAMDLGRRSAERLMQLTNVAQAKRLVPGIAQQIDALFDWPENIHRSSVSAAGRRSNDLALEAPGTEEARACHSSSGGGGRSRGS